MQRVQVRGEHQEALPIARNGISGGSSRIGFFWRSIVAGVTVSLQIGMEEKHWQVHISQCVSSCILTPPNRQRRRGRRVESSFRRETKNGRAEQIQVA